MKTKIPIAMIGIIIAGAAATRWKPADPAPASVSSALTATNKPACPASELTMPSSVSRRVRPSVKNSPAQLLARIQEALGSTDSDERENVLANELAALVRADPLAAARFAETNDLGGSHDLILHRVAQLWAARDTSAALDWAAALGDARERDEILTDVFLQIAESDPAEAVRTRSRYVTDEKPNPGLEALAQRWADKDFSAARDWGLSRSAGAQRDQLIARLAYVQSQTAPFDAATLVVENVPEGQAQTEAVMAVLHQWGLRDQAAAGKWVGSFAEGDLRTRAVNELSGIAQSHPESTR
ncbi:MAG: hypothetical protein ABIS50_13855 [Luteolibacter sp.]|uniref:hypothetical protein n=1 Tax=Luteolibacter sp. TaxID=1962973 RepID=UPI0032667452